LWDSGDTSFISSTSIDGSGIFGSTPLINCQITTNNIKIIGLRISNATSIAIEMNNHQNSSIENCRFINNGNNSTWGVLRLFGNSIVKECYFTQNQCRYLINLSGFPPTGFPQVTQCVFEKNGTVADISNWEGKGIIFAERRGRITNNLIYDNYIPAIVTGGNSDLDTTIAIHNTIFGNHNVGIYFQNWYGGSVSLIYNNIIEGNPQNIYFNNMGFSFAKLERNLVKPYFYNTPSPFNFSIVSIDNDTISSSGYSSANILSKDFTLPNVSPAVLGKGLLSQSIPFDIYGAIRPNPAGSQPDLGAIESEYAFSAPFLVSALSGNAQATLNWTIVNHPAVTKYRIFMSEFPIPDNSTEGIVVDNILHSIDTYLVEGLDDSILYYFRMQSGDDSGNWSGMSNELRMNLKPLVNDDNVLTDEDIPIIINVLANDFDIEGIIDPSTVHVITAPNNGEVSVDLVTGLVTYTPNLNFNGTDSFVYEVCDNGVPSPLLCSHATVTIIVQAVNDAPFANNDSAITDEDNPVAIAILSNDSDVDGNIVPSSVTIVSGASNGDLTIDPITGDVTYTPYLNFNGVDSFVYAVCDDGTPLPSECSQATVTITVQAVNDAPFAISLSNSSIVENQNNMLIGLFSTEDVDDGDTFTYDLVNGAGSNDNTSFMISGNQLFNNTAFNYEVQNSFSIRVRSTDSGGLFVEDIFFIEVLNQNDITITYSFGNTYCNGDQGIGWINPSVQEFNGDLAFLWSGPNGFQSSDQAISGLESGQYMLTVTDDFHSQSATIDIETMPVYDDLEICYVTSDSLNSQRNRIYFSNPGMYNVEKFQILRESGTAGNYDLIGQVNASDSSFFDAGSDNTSLSYKYRVRSLDSCGSFSSESPVHRTILLQANLGLNNTVNLSWNPYEGAEYSTYLIYRSQSGEPFQQIISLPTSNTSFNDVTADVSLNDYIYFVGIQINSCDFTRQSNMIRSNEKKLYTLSVSEFYNQLSGLIVYPNPALTLLTIQGEGIEGEDYIILDIQGREIMKGKIAAAKDALEVSFLASGQYFLRIGYRQVSFTKE
jgi:hypothetical protein